MKVENTIKAGYMASPSLLMNTDYKAFKKTNKEKEQLLNMKLKNKEDRKREFKSDYKKHLNIKANQFQTIKATF